MILVQFSLGVILLCQVLTDARYYDSADSGRDKEVKPLEVPFGETAKFQRDRRHITEEESYDEQPEKKHRPHRNRRQFTYGHYPPPSLFRETRYDTAPYDSFAYISKSLDEIVSLLRQRSQQPPPPPPPLPQLQPFYVPYFVNVPQFGCGCAPAPSTPNAVNTNITTPGLDNRFKGMEDQRQIWGTVESNSNTQSNPKVAPASDSDDYDDEPIRPISFTPVKPDRPLSRPPPPVDHGTVQAGMDGQPSAQPAATEDPTVSSEPTNCDIAIITCCHQKVPTLDCFRRFGCTSNIRVASACDSSVISTVINVFQKYYGVQK